MKSKQYYINNWMLETAKLKGIEEGIKECTGNLELRKFLIDGMYNQLYNVVHYGLAMNGLNVDSKDLPNPEENSELYAQCIKYYAYKNLKEEGLINA